MENITLASLIEEQKKRMSHLTYVPSPQGCIGFSYYCYEDSENYLKWLKTASRFIGINFPDDKDVIEFEKISREEMSPEQQQALLAILEALSCFPTVIQSKVDNQNEITVNTNINNSNSQSQNQEQSVAINLFLEAIKDDLTGKQVKELKDILMECGNDKTTVWKRIVEKLKSFGSDVASNIVANILTNPAIWSGFVN